MIWTIGYGPYGPLYVMLHIVGFMPLFAENQLDFSQILFREMKMRLATSCHHTNPRSATLHFWRQTSSLDEYKRIQHMRRIQTNQPTSSNHKKEEHLVIAHRLAEMEKRRIGTRFLEHEVREEDKAKPLFTTITEACSIM